MKFVAATYGTEGDTRPLAALCRALMDAGHEALLLADSATLGAASALNVPSVALAGDIKGTLQPTLAISGVVAGEQGFSGTANALARIANTNAEAWLREIVAAGKGCDAIIVSGLAAFAGLSAAEHLGVKAIGAGFIPITPTAAFASPFLPPRYIPAIFNRASHHFVNGMLWRAFRKKINAARTAVCGLPPRHELWTDHPMLFGVSPSLLTDSGCQPADWPVNAHAYGQWVPPSSINWCAPKALADFLEAGEAPMYIGFGSMMGFDRSKLLSDVIEAVAGRRALFYPGWSGVDRSALPVNFHVIDETPHDWLFPRTSLVVHHGGSGTTHSAARSGVPSVVVPFAGDQFFWADRLRRAGVAADPVDGRRLRASSLVQGIEFAERAEVRARAQTLGIRIRAEHGLANTVSTIEKLMSV
ncbi:glycosyltransferase [Paraburkholderia haematera]|uniref:O-mycaminosyltylonolide 6-deoxyallosyltransferase n=1 Tax=Paraburkholderia haematera TaxID=2793077 RepID=A0ABN7KYY1_9BURK|nr:glycosyltransferase [Paraburkholderia haematera]CAE6721170.1 O-mycaminosyltylonolide 6-deoxyallosyltransferase [Paraburkholderia haematera]